jgi:predicted DNA-binding transcriptional regulator YafY
MSSNNQTLLRQWTILKLIPKYPQKISTTALLQKLAGAQFSVSKRTVERDLNALSLTFPLTVDDRNKPYGWSWAQDAPSFSLPGLTSHEALMLVMAAEHLSHLLPSTTNDTLNPYFKAAALHLKNQENQQHIKPWPAKIRNVAANQPLLSPVVDANIQKTLTDALLSEQQLNISYQAHGEAEPSKARVHPLAIISRGNVLYTMVCFFDYTDIRLLAMHRIKAATLLEKPANIPANFNLDEELAKGKLGFGNGDMMNLIAEFRHDLGEYFFETPLSADQTLSISANQTITLNATVANTQQLRWWLLGFGAGVKVLQPTQLKDEIKAEVERMQLKYQ